jgi:hypothetical protein
MKLSVEPLAVIASIWRHRSILNYKTAIHYLSNIEEEQKKTNRNN